MRIRAASVLTRASQTMVASRRVRQRPHDAGSTECLAQHPRSSTRFRVGASSKRVRAGDRSSAGGKIQGNQNAAPGNETGKRKELTLGTVCIFAEGSSFYSAREQRATMCAMGKVPRGAALSGVQGIRILSSLSQIIIVSSCLPGVSETRMLPKVEKERE